MYKVNILKDSINTVGCRLTTFEVSYPRIELAACNTHRVFSRNYSSSRAIPIAKFIKQLQEDPFIPVYWGKHQAGMGASEEVNDETKALASGYWLEAMDNAIEYANKLLELGVAKEITNRLLEPWMWVTGIISTTSLDNFFTLRCDLSAQPEIRVLANMMKAAYLSNTPNLLSDGEWHIPMVTPYEEGVYSIEEQIKIATGRLARVSYLTHDGKRNPDLDIELHDKLLISKHLSPTEHCSMNMSNDLWYGNFQGWKQYRKFIPNESGMES